MGFRSRRFLIVDDHEIVRTGVRALFESAFADCEIHEAAETDTAYRLFQTVSPDVAIIDLNLPGSGGLDLIGRVSARDENAKMIVLSMRAQTSFARRALRSGARGYVAKAVAATELIKAVRTVLEGKVYIDSTTALDVARAALHNEESRLERLSPREFDVFCALASGCAPREIATQLKLSINTVGNYRRTLMRKLEVSTMAELVHLAIEQGVLTESAG